MSILTVSETGSTNDDLLAMARDGATEGSWLRADTQTGGRGRLGRAWVSPPSNFYASTLVRRRVDDPPAAGLSLLAAVALDEAVCAFVPADRAMLKWPNDLLIDGAKLSGILIEAADDALVVGIGVNLAHHPEGLGRATISLGKAIRSGPPSPDAFLATLAPLFAAWLTWWRRAGIAPVRERWLARAHPIGTKLATSDAAGRPLIGTFAGLGEDGALLLRGDDGAIATFHAGDVTLAG